MHVFIMSWGEKSTFALPFFIYQSKKYWMITLVESLMFQMEVIVVFLKYEMNRDSQIQKRVQSTVQSTNHSFPILLLYSSLKRCCLEILILKYNLEWYWSKVDQSGWQNNTRCEDLAYWTFMIPLSFIFIKKSIQTLSSFSEQETSAHVWLEFNPSRLRSLCRKTYR